MRVNPLCTVLSMLSSFVQSYPASLFSAGLWHLPSLPRTFWLLLILTAGFAGSFMASTLPSSLHMFFSSWYLTMPWDFWEMQRSVCSSQVKCWLTPTEGLTLQNSAPGKVSPVLDLSRQTVSTATGTKNTVLLLYLGALLSGRIQWK